MHRFHRSEGLRFRNESSRVALDVRPIGGVIYARPPLSKGLDSAFGKRPVLIHSEVLSRRGDIDHVSQERQVNLSSRDAHECSLESIGGHLALPVHRANLHHLGGGHMDTKNNYRAGAL